MPGTAPFIASYRLEDLSAEGIPFHLETLTTDASRHKHLMAAHRHGYFMLGVCLEGDSTHMLDFQQVTIQAGEMLLIVPGQVHQPVSNNTRNAFIVAFSADFMLDQQVILPAHPFGPVKLSERDLMQVHVIMNQMAQEYQERPAKYVAMLQHYLSLLLTLFYRHAAAHIHSGAPLLVRYRELLATHFLEWTKPAQYAAAMHITVDHLNDVIKQHTGQTVSAHINERRVLEAKRLLLHAKESIKEIAWHLQFNELSYFNRFFKQHTGSTPAAFREKAREKYLSDPE